MIAVVNYGMGNIRSVVNALEFLGAPSRVVEKPHEILKSEKLILPGVGSFFRAMQNLHERGFVEPLNEVVLVKQRPLLGICLGMQLLATHGTEDGDVPGLGWIPGRVIRFSFDNPTYRVPHTGFNTVEFGPNPCPLYDRLDREADFYFVHSYHFECENRYITGQTDYHGPVVASVVFKNIYGVQFHPEKSQSNGLVLLRNFIDL